MSAESQRLVWNPRPQLIKRLAECVQPILDRQDKKTGRFGTKPWICSDQNVLLPLAAAWAIKDPANPWYCRKALLDAIMLGGDALIDDQDARGMWTFRKKDGSTWGQIAMPWTYSRWVRAFALIKDAMPAARRAKWEKRLRLGYTTISKTAVRQIHNIPCHHAMGLYCAGQVFGRDDWKKQAAAFVRKVARTQHKDGFWSEHRGPVVIYNFVYVEAIGAYHALSGDKSVLPALRRAAVFHANLTYPDGINVETVDGRNPYHPGRVSAGNVGFTFTPEARGFMLQQAARMKAAGRKVGADHAAQLLLYGAAGPATPPAGDADSAQWKSSNGKIAVRRREPWFTAVSAYTAPVPANRWGQDRQNFVSVFHDKTGLIVGGGNTKLQPWWSNFTVGDRKLLRHKRGDASPRFVPPPGLIHTPSQASLKTPKGGGLNVTLDYGAESGSVTVTPVDDSQVRIVYACTPKGKRPVHGHLTLIPHVGRVVKTGAGASEKLSGKAIDLSAKAAGGWIEHAGWRLAMPAGTRLVWPKKAHNPYRKTGHSHLSEGRLAVEMKFSAARPSCEFLLTVR